MNPLHSREGSTREEKRAYGSGNRMEGRVQKKRGVCVFVSLAGQRGGERREMKDFNDIKCRGLQKQSQEEHYL